MRDSPLGAGWRAERERIQEDAMPDGRVVVSCPAPYGVGGLGRHLREIADALERRGHPPLCICHGAEHTPPRVRRGQIAGVAAGALKPFVRFSPAWRIWSSSVRFDAAAARRLPIAEHLIAFNGTALAQFRVAGRTAVRSRSLMSANSHIRKVVRQHERAYRAHPIERPWATRLVGRNLAEYSRADRIHVCTRYAWESFSEEGFPDETLAFFPLTPDPRYRPASEAPSASTFDVVYSGSLLVHKGVPLLIEAFRRLAHEDLRLVLVGGWKTRGMRRFIEQTCSEDQRIRAGPGDPLAHLHAARLCVHPAYEDGFAYAPAEALACGVPVIVSEDTGMKELIGSERDGLVLPTGDADALAQAIDAAYRGEMFGV
jgi:glycosyltransferase involved in cell wall biosynthesis